MELLLRIVPPCLFYKLTGFYCPGCGGTRSVHALLSGHIVQSVYYHPVVLYTVICVGWYLLKRTAALASNDKWNIKMPAPGNLINGAAVIVIVNVLFRNIAYLFWGLTL